MASYRSSMQLTQMKSKYTHPSWGRINFIFMSIWWKICVSLSNFDKCTWCVIMENTKMTNTDKMCTTEVKVWLKYSSSCSCYIDKTHTDRETEKSSLIATSSFITDWHHGVLILCTKVVNIVICIMFNWN